MASFKDNGLYLPKTTVSSVSLPTTGFSNIFLNNDDGTLWIAKDDGSVVPLLDNIDVSSLSTSATDTSLIIKPDGSGGFVLGPNPATTPTFIRYLRTTTLDIGDNEVITWNNRTNSADHPDSSTTFTAPSSGFYHVSGRARTTGSGVLLEVQLNNNNWLRTGYTVANDNLGPYFGQPGLPFIIGYIKGGAGSPDHDDHMFSSTLYLDIGDTIRWVSRDQSGDLLVTSFFNVAKVS